MVAKLKMGNKPVWFDLKTWKKYESKVNGDCIYFDSTSEFELWLHLHRLYPLATIERQYPLIIKPATSNYPESFWKVDFALTFESGEKIFIEYKGDWIKQDSVYLCEFRKTIEMLELCNTAAWERLVIIGDKTWCLDHCINVYSKATAKRRIDELLATLS